jgi:hypothetical protein
MGDVRILPDGPCNPIGAGTKIILANTTDNTVTATIRQDVNGVSGDIYVTVGPNQQSILGCTVGIDGASQWSWNLLSYTSNRALFAKVSRKLTMDGQHPCTHEDCTARTMYLAGACSTIAKDKGVATGILSIISNDHRRTTT